MKEPKYWQAVQQAEDLDTWFKAINKTLDTWNYYHKTKIRRATDPEFQQKLCAYEKKKNIKRTELGLRKAEGAQRRAHKLQAMPVWADTDKIKDIYKIATLTNIIAELSGDSYHVDHIVPLVAKNKHSGEQIACGLHIHTNLQILHSKENIEKSCILSNTTT